MPKYEKITWDQIPPEIATDLIREISITLQLFTTALLKISSEASTRKKVIHIGSGTFVKVGEVYGILTANHVVGELEKEDSLGLVIAREGQEHEFTIPVNDLHIINIGIPETEKDGPDLSFIIIPVHRIGTIKATKQFFPVLLYQDNNLGDDKPTAGFWCICGSPETMTLVENSSVFDTVISFCNYCGIGGIPTYDEKDGWDYCEITVDYEYSNNIPPKFNGVSGGGFWQIIISNEENNPFKIKDHVLSGVVFWQSQREENSRSLRCHSRNSIYKNLTDTLQEKGII